MFNNVKSRFIFGKTVFIILVLTTDFAFAQTIYQVEPGMKGNKIVLTIENTSSKLSVNVLEIAETNLSEFISIKDNAITIANIEKSSEKEIEIEFDVSSKAPINENDTLHFVLNSSNGENWSKEIILEYTPPREFALFQNYPNPFNPSTTIKYAIPSNAKSEMLNVKIAIFDILGREVETLINQKQQPGNYEVVFNASHLSSGTYFYRLTAGNFSKTMKFIILK